MDLLKRFKECIIAHNLFSEKERLLIAVSGGLDSVVLCALCKQAGYDFEMAHCNFQLRANESDGDEALVNTLAAQYQVNVWVKKFDTEVYAANHKLNIQLAARELRYQWFEELLAADKNKPLQYLLTAHHANDNIETLLINFFKGTGINGLQAIEMKKAGLSKKTIRPLLFAKKEDLLLFAQKNNLVWREDASNATDKYTRNYFRNQIIPSIEKVFPQVEDNLINNISRFKDIETLYLQSINLAKKKLIEVKGNEWFIPVLKLQKTPAVSTVLYEIIKEIGFHSAQIPAVLKLLTAASGKYISSSSHRILRNRNWLIISPHDAYIAAPILVESADAVIEYAGNKLQFEWQPSVQKIKEDTNLAYINFAEIKFPLLLRKWKQGDYFYPLGMNKKKKLSRFFVDQKLSLLQKEKVWVIESDKKIIWVVGYRIDNRFKIKDATKEHLFITLTPAK